MEQRIKILLTDELLAGIPARTRDWYPADDVEFILAGKAEEDELIRTMADADILMNMRRRVDRRLLEAGSRLAMVQQCGVGVDHIDLSAANALGIRICSAAGSGVIPVAEHAVMLMLAIARQIIRSDQTMRQGEWIQGDLFGRIDELYGKTLGIVGFGRIGQRVAKIALHGFDMRVQYFDKFEVDTAAVGSGIRRVTLDELLRSSDYVSLHCNLTEETRGLIGARELAMMKPTAFLINTARGAVVDEDALAEALRQGAIKGAGLDVFGFFNDGPPADSPLRTLSNVVLTPHVATMTPENLDRTFYDIALRNVMAFVGGAEPRHTVNAPALPRPLLKSPLARMLANGAAGPFINTSAA